MSTKGLARFVGIAALLFILTQSTAFADDLINTIPSWSGGSGDVSAPPFPSTGVSFGEVLTVPIDGNFVLNGFSILFDNPRNSNINLRADLIQFLPGTGEGVGPILFQSVVFSPSSPAPQLETFSTGGLNLTPGGTYMLFVTTLNTPECGMTGNLAGFVGLAPKSSYPAGWSGAIRLLAVTVWASSGSSFLSTRIKSLPSRLTLQFPSPPHSPFSVPDSQRCPGFAGSALPRPSKLNP